MLSLQGLYCSEWLTKLTFSYPKLRLTRTLDNYLCVHQQSKSATLSWSACQQRIVVFSPEIKLFLCLGRAVARPYRYGRDIQRDVCEGDCRSGT